MDDIQHKLETDEQDVGTEHVLHQRGADGLSASVNHKPSDRSFGLCRTLKRSPREMYSAFLKVILTLGLLLVINPGHWSHEHQASGPRGERIGDVIKVSACWKYLTLVTPIGDRLGVAKVRLLCEESKFRDHLENRPDQRKCLDRGPHQRRRLNVRTFSKLVNTCSARSVCLGSGLYRPDRVKLIDGCTSSHDNNSVIGFDSEVVGSTGCPTKNYTLFWGAVAPSKLELFSNVRGVSESSRPKLSNEY